MHHANAAASIAGRPTAGLRCAMADGYDCYHNALAERVNGILKDESLFLLPDYLAQARLLAKQPIPWKSKKPVSKLETGFL